MPDEKRSTTIKSRELLERIIIKSAAYMEEENRFKLEDVLKVISTVTTLLFAASEVLRQARLMKKEQNTK